MNEENCSSKKYPQFSVEKFSAQNSKGHLKLFFVKLSLFKLHCHTQFWFLHFILLSTMKLNMEQI